MLWPVAKSAKQKWSRPCELLLRARLVPGRAGTSTQVIAHIPLSQLRAMPRAADLEEAWIRAFLGEDGYLVGKDAEAAACDAQVVPVVTGTMDPSVIEHRVILSAYAGGDLGLSTPEGAYYGGMETLGAKRESAVRSVRVREAHDRIARQGKPSGGGRRWFGYTRVFANPEETVKRKRVILREEVNPVEAEALQDAAERILRGESVGSVIREGPSAASARPGAAGGKRRPW
jgi:hypothetical protein